jgi:16S rRNA (cytosine967-C5)-methyltransferase
MATFHRHIPPSLGKSVAEALQAIFIERRYADKVIEYTLRNNPKAGSADRAFIAESTYEVVRYYRLYVELLGHQPQGIDDFWQLLAVHLLVRKDIWPAWRELDGLDRAVIQARVDAADMPRAVRESVPDWIDQIGSQELGELWPPTLHALNQPARVILRTNTLRTNRNDLLHRLAEEGIEAEPYGPSEAVVLTRRKNVFQTGAFKAGWFEVQDYSSQQVARLLGPEPGMRVVDACAGGGGKTLHMSALMGGKGSLIALDTLAWKLEALRLRARRAGATNIDARVIDSSKVIKRLHGSADRLLLDVPCSGLGVLKRNPDTKWKLEVEELERLKSTQQHLLQTYCLMLRPGGRMVYATCSVLPAENNIQVASFLDSPVGAGFRVLSERTILPQEEGFDGFYMALLEKE